MSSVNMSDKPIVFHIAKWYPNRQDNMLGVFVKRHILSTLPYTTAVAIYAMACPDVKNWYEIECQLDEGIHTYRAYYKKNITGIKPFDKFVKLCLYFFVVVKMCRRAKRKVGNPSIYHAHVMLRTVILSYVLSKKDNVPYVVLEHATRFIRKEIPVFNSILEKKMTTFFLEKSASVIAVSESLANAIRNSCAIEKTKFHVIYNCVDTNIFHSSIKIKKEKKEFIYVAEFIDGHKNISGLLHVIRKLSLQRQDFMLRIVGYGKDELVLKELAKELLILDSIVFFEGKRSGIELVQFIQNAEALLLFSNYENLPCVITESFCCGVPVVSTSVGGISEIVNDNNGVLIDRGDQQAMLIALNKVLNEELVFDRSKIARNAVDLFSNESVGRQLNEVYKEAMLC